MRIQISGICLLFTILTTSSAQTVECETYWKNFQNLQDSISLKFEDRILSQIERTGISDENVAFLKKLSSFIRLSPEDKIKNGTFDKPIVPVFQLIDRPTGVFAFKKMACVEQENGRTRCNDQSHEAKAIRNNNEYMKGSGFMQDTLGYCPISFEDLKPSHSIFIYTTDKTYQDAIVAFGYNNDACREYYVYELGNQQSSKVLFGSKFQLQMEYLKDESIDKAIKKHSPVKCFDCVSEYEPELVFAKLKGVDNLYFTYTDSFDPENQYDYPRRSIIMVLEDGRVAYLWSESVDLFGCACL